MAHTTRTCPICGDAFTGGKHNKKYCGPACQAEAGRRRAAAYYAKHKGSEALRHKAAAASRRHFERTKADPEYYAARRAAAAAWREANPERVRQAERAYWKSNATRKREKDHRRRARLLGSFVEDVSLAVLFARDAGLCGVCGGAVSLDVSWPDRLAATIDHVIPLARNGEHSYANTQLAHMGCNASKGDR